MGKSGSSQKNAGSRSSAQHRDVGQKGSPLSPERTDSDCLQEQDEIAAYARMALSKLKDQSERCTIADEVLRLVAVEKEKAKPDPVVFHNGCLLLYDLHCEAEFSQYADRYANLIEQAYGLDGKDLADMKKTLSQI